MTTKISPQRRAKVRRGGILPRGAVRLGCERLEERAFLAGDLEFQNQANPYDVNNDGAVNRFDVFALVSELRLFGERSLTTTTTSGTSTAGTEGEGEAPAAPLFVDVNGDGDLDRRDAFSLIGQLRAEGEQNPVDANLVIIKYHLGIFQDLGNGNVIELTTDADGAGPGTAIAVPQNSNLLLRVFVEDTGLSSAGVSRDPAGTGANFGIGTFALDIDYTDPNSVFTVTNGAAAAEFVGNGPANAFVTPTGDVDPLYDGAFSPGIDDNIVDRVRNIRGQNTEIDVGGQPVFVGLGAKLAFEIPFSTGATAPILPIVTIATIDFTDDVAHTFFDATQDGFLRGSKDPGNPQNNFSIITQVDDDQLQIAVVDDVSAIPDVAILHELPAPNAAPVSPITDVQATLATIDVTINDFVPVGNVKGVTLGPTDGLPVQGVVPAGTVALNLGADLVSVADDQLDYSPPSPFFVTGATPVTFTYTLVDHDAAQVPTGQTRVGSVSVDLREFNFPPVPSAVGLDEAVLGVPARTVPQGGTLNILSATLLANDSDGDTGIDTTPAPGELLLPQALQIPANEIFEVLLNGVVDTRPGRASSDGAGNLIFEADPGFVPALGDVVEVRYQVEDINGLEQDLQPGVRPFAVNNKRAPQTLEVFIQEVDDLAEFTVEFFADAAGTIPLNGEVDELSSFFAFVFITDLRAGVAAEGAQNAFVDLTYENNMVETTTSAANAADITRIAPYDVGGAGFTILPNTLAAPLNLVDNVGGTDAVGPNAAGPQAVYRIAMTSADLNVSTFTTFTPLFAGAAFNNHGGTAQDPSVTLFGLPGQLNEAQIRFTPAQLLVAVGEKPIANDDFYTITEDVTKTVSDLNPPNAYIGVPGVFDQNRGVLNNDDDTTDAVPGNVLIAVFDGFSVDPAAGTLFLEEAGTGNFLPVTGLAPGFQWNGGFQFVPVPNFFHAPGDFESFTYHILDPNQRVSDIATVQLRVVSDPDAPVGVDDRDATGVKYEVAKNTVLEINRPGTFDGSGAQVPLPGELPFGLLNNDTDSDPNEALSAQLLTRPDPAHGTLTLLYDDGLGGFNEFVVDSDAKIALAPANWKGIFKFEPVLNLRGVIATFNYQAVDNDNLASAPTRVDLEIGLADIVITGHLYVDDSNVNRAGEQSTGTGGNGQFGFDDVNFNNVWDVGEPNIERTLGGVDLTLNPDANAAPPGPILPGAVFSPLTVVTDATGQFTMATQPGGIPVPAGNYSLTADARLAQFFNPPANANTIPVEESVADAIFGELGLRTQFIDFNEFLASTSRDGIHIGYDDTPGATDPIVWYTIDRGPGWSVFNNNITNLTFANGIATLEFTRPDLSAPGTFLTVRVAIPVTNGTHYSEVRQGNLRVVHIMGTAATLEALFRAP